MTNISVVMHYGREITDGSVEYWKTYLERWPVVKKI